MIKFLRIFCFALLTKLFIELVFFSLNNNFITINYQSFLIFCLVTFLSPFPLTYLFYFLLFFLAQSQIVQTQSINSRSISLSRPSSLLQTLQLAFHSGFFFRFLNRRQENKTFLFLLPNTHYTFLSNLYNCCMGGENRISFFNIFFAVQERYVNEFLYCFSFSFICFNQTNYNSCYYCLYQHSLRCLVLFTDTLAVPIVFFTLFVRIFAQCLRPRQSRSV